MFKSKSKTVYKITPKVNDNNKIQETPQQTERKMIGGAYNELDKNEMKESKQIKKTGDNLKKFIEINL